MHDETLHAERAIRAGARGYITKQEATTRVMVAIRQIMNGEIYWSERAAARRLLKSPARRAAVGESPVDCLTDRELQVFEMIGSGKSTRQISASPAY